MREVIKVGGSLLDLPDLPRRLTNCIQADAHTLIVVGGGQPADAVRTWNMLHPMSDDIGHELAVHAMALNARMLHATLHADESQRTAWRAARRITWCDDLAAWQAAPTPTVAVIDPVAALHQLAACGLDAIRTWDFTSDSIAALIAKGDHADRLTLCKSVDAPSPATFAEATAAHLVDPCFAASATTPDVGVINLRAPAPRRVRLARP